MKALKFGNGLVISSHILPDMWLLIHEELKLIHDSKSGPSSVFLSPSWLTCTLTYISSYNYILFKIIEHSIQHVKWTILVSIVYNNTITKTCICCSDTIPWYVEAWTDDSYLPDGVLCEIYWREFAVSLFELHSDLSSRDQLTKFQH